MADEGFGSEIEEIILGIAGLGTAFAVANLMVSSAHNTSSGFALALGQWNANNILELATLTKSVDQILGSHGKKKRLVDSQRGDSEAQRRGQGVDSGAGSFGKG